MHTASDPVNDRQGARADSNSPDDRLEPSQFVHELEQFLHTRLPPRDGGAYE